MFISPTCFHPSAIHFPIQFIKLLSEVSDTHTLEIEKQNMFRKRILSLKKYMKIQTVGLGGINPQNLCGFCDLGEVDGEVLR